MRSKLFVSALMVLFELGGLNVGAIAAEIPNDSALKLKARKPKPTLSGAKQLIREGREQEEQGNPVAAIKLFNEAAALAKANKQREVEARAMGALGDIHSDLKKPQEAIDFYRKAALLHQSIQKFDGAVENLFDIFRAHIKQKRIDLAIIVLDDIEKLIPKLNAEQKLDSLESLGRKYQRVGRFDKSLTLGQEILDLTYSSNLNPSQNPEPEPDLEKDDDDDNQVSDQDSTRESELNEYREDALTSMSVSAHALNDKNAANHYNQTLIDLPSLSKRRTKERVEISRLSGLADLYYELNYGDEAIGFYQQALEKAKISGNRNQEVTILGEVAIIYSEIGPYIKEVESYRQIQTIANLINLSEREEDNDGDKLLLNLGIAYYRLGSYSEATQSFEQLISKLNDIKESSQSNSQLKVLFEAKLYLALTYYSIGDYTKSEGQYLAIVKDLNNPKNKKLRKRSMKRFTARSLDGLGEISRIRQNDRKALDYYNQALQAADDSSHIRSGILNHLGMTYQSVNRIEESIALYETLVNDFQSQRSLWDLSHVLHNLGNAYSLQKKYDRSIVYYQKSLALRQQIGDRQGEATTLTNLAQLFKAQNQPQLAILFYKQSVSLYENIRMSNRTLPKDQQKTYTKTVEKSYRDLADLLLKDDRILEAQQVLDLLKVQELNTYLKNVRGASQPLEALPPETEILKKYSAIQANAIALGQELSTLRQTPEPSRSPQQMQRINQLDQLQRDLNQQFNGFTDRPDIKTLIEALSPKVRRQTIDTADLNALRANLKQLNAVIIYPLILDDRLELIITTPDSPPLRRTVQIKREDFNKAILDLRIALESNDDRIDSYAQKLYTWLIKPLEADLKASNPKTLIYAPDGQLRYIPIAALHDGKQWLAERYAINHITAKSLTNFTQRPQQQPKILAGAIGGKTSEETQVKVGTRSFDFVGLPGTNVEIDRIQSLQPSTQLLKETQFTLPKLLPQFADYNILHLATHAAIVPGNPEDSFILFGGKTTATLKDIENWDLNSFDLVILSACQTGLAGNFGTNGEEVLGLGYQFQNRGAKATIASLWKVDDNSTQQLMTEFYSALKAGKTKNQALQAAQITLISGTAKSTGSIDAPYRHPYYWAPFILIGNGL